MARKDDTHADPMIAAMVDIDPNEYMSDDERRITIVREITVGQVRFNPDSDETMLQVAFRVAGDAMADALAPGKPDRIRFFHGEHTFTITADPMDNG
jgi:hypothetical protein